MKSIIPELLNPRARFNIKGIPHIISNDTPIKGDLILDLLPGNPSEQ